MIGSQPIHRRADAADFPQFNFQTEVQADQDADCWYLVEVEKLERLRGRSEWTWLTKGTDDAKAVMAKMREMPINDFFAKNGRIREDGRMVHDMYVYEVKKPSESKGEWDYYKLRAVIPGDEAFRSLKDSACPLVKKG